MTRIGAGWLKVDKNKEHYISIKIDDALLPLTITTDKVLIMKPNRNKEGDKQPDYYLDLFVPKKEDKATEKEDTGFSF